MERWAANTLRTLAIILTAGLVVVTSLFLLLLTLCAAQGGIGGTKHPDLVVPYLLAAVAVLATGIWFIVWLARGIFRSSLVAEPQAAVVPASGLPPCDSGSPASSVPLHLSHSSRKAIDRLVLALCAQIAVSAATWIFGQLHYWSRPQTFAPHNWTLILLAPYVLYHVPYAILICLLLKRPDRRTFAYSLAVPAVLLLQSVFSLGVLGHYYVHQPQGILLFVLPWLIHILILVLAYQAIRQVGLHPPPSSLIVAAVTSYIFFSAIHVITPFLYRSMWR
jgi:hypothetical protein